MKVAFYSMLKNEQVFAPAFGEMLNEFADYIYIVDHDSCDDTIMIIKEKVKNARIYNLTSARYPQSELSNFFARLIFSETDADFIFFLDADEFIPFKTKFELQDFLIAHGKCHAIELPWNNISPNGDSFSSGFTTMGPSKNVFKIVLSRSISDCNDYKIAQGNHYVKSVTCNLKVCRQLDKQLLHIPIASYTNLLIKLIKGIRSLENDKLNRIYGNGGHWYELANLITSDDLTKNQINDIIYRYSGNLPSGTDEADLDFDFPYIMTRRLSFNSIDDALIHCLHFILGKRLDDFNNGSSDIIVKDEYNNIVFLERYQEWKMVARMIYHRVKLKVPYPMKMLLKKMYVGFSKS